MNPFRPSFGTTPAVVAGRDGLVASVGMALREGPGSPYRFTLVSGARGAGKTVLLNLLEKEAANAGWHVIRVAASRDLISELKDVSLPRLLQKLGRSSTHRTITGGSLAGVGSLTTEISSDRPRESLRTRLRDACTLLAEQDSGLLLTLDELQSAAPEDLHLLSDAIQDVVRDELPVALSVAGLPFEIAKLLDLPGTTFLRRAMPVQLGPLPDHEVAATLQATAQTGGRHFSDPALDRAVAACRGYAYLIQVVGSISWVFAKDDSITDASVQRALPQVRERIGLQVHQPALRGLPDREREYLDAMVSLGTPAPTGAIAQALGVPPNQQSTYRRRLLERGLITPNGHGLVDFGLPYLGDYLRNN
ncbi:ATP-binding protein [Corynebacterium sp.]|uniref:ATP-binding protein n=1 Tax=Corynebacterium sp. TaxID=1720 RepID=UPI0026E02853|nr:ATP-binding protein [Corynebacterium sp.]MDO5513515.1 ATP-binding protein [Corynebacterium sp.]